jgi:preprotein translocase subunit SecY
MGLIRLILLLMVMVFVIAAIIFIERGSRRITVQYAKRVVGRGCTAARARISR